MSHGAHVRGTLGHISAALSSAAASPPAKAADGRRDRSTDRLKRQTVDVVPVPAGLDREAPPELLDDALQRLKATTDWSTLDTGADGKTSVNQVGRRRGGHARCRKLLGPFVWAFTSPAPRLAPSDAAARLPHPRTSSASYPPFPRPTRLIARRAASAARPCRRRRRP